MDNRDAGESEPETDDYGLGDSAGDVAALIDALGIDRTHVVAHSMGGDGVPQLALAHPARLDRLLLVSLCVGGEPEHRAGAPLPPPAQWWIDDPVERSRRSLPVALGRDHRGWMDEADVAAIAELERRHMTTRAGTMHREAAS